MSIIIEPLWDRPVPFYLLELADPSRAHIQSYIDSRSSFVAISNENIVGIIVITKANRSKLEIRNVAVSSNHQRKGIGRRLLVYAQHFAKKEGFKNLIIATGNSSIHQLALYQKLGFKVIKTEIDFFIKNYKEPIFENGIQCKHKIILEKKL